MPAPCVRAFPVLTLALSLAGCAAPTTTSQVPTYPSVTGDWQFQAAEFVTGSLSSSGGTVTGILHAGYGLQPGCVPLSTDLPATGTIDSSGNMTLTAPVAGGVATIVVNLDSRPPILTGTFQVIGGACAKPLATLTAFPVANITGTFTGNLSDPVSAAPTLSVIATLTESVAPNADGQYPVTGTVVASGACTSTLAITQGIVAGDSLASTGPPTGLVQPGSFTASLPPTTPLQIIALLNQFPGCGTTAFQGVLTRQ